MTSSRQPLRRSTIKGKVSIAERRSNQRKRTVKAVSVDVVAPFIVQQESLQVNEIKAVNEVVEVVLPPTPVEEPVAKEKKVRKKKEVING